MIFGDDIDDDDDDNDDDKDDDQDDDQDEDDAQLPLWHCRDNVKVKYKSPVRDGPAQSS